MMMKITQEIEQLGSDLFVYMTTTYVGAILIILFATTLAVFKIRRDEKIPMFSPLQGEIQRWAAVVVLYIIGFTIIYFKAKGEL